MFWFRSMALGAFLCATNSVFAEGISHFSDLYDAPPMKPVVVSGSLASYTIAGPTNFSGLHNPLGTLTPMPATVRRISTESVSLIGTSWQGSYGAHSAEKLLETGSPKSWHIATAGIAAAPSFGMGHEDEAGVPNLTPSFAMPLLQQESLAPSWDVGR